MKISTLLLRYRNKNKLGQSELARQLGVSHTLLSLLESDQRPLSVKMAVTLSQKLNLDQSKLIKIAQQR